MKTETLQGHGRQFLTDWLPSIVLLALILAARSSPADHYDVPSGPMESAP